MIKNCRNCSSSEIYTTEVNTYGEGGPNLLPIGWFTTGKFHIFVCVNCGLVEWFVPQDYLNKVKKHFTHVDKIGKFWSRM